VFEVGRVNSRRQEFHGPYGGQWQGGISTPSGWPFILLFTGESGEQYGYQDGWDENGVFLYTGEGQVGDMEFVRGNRAVRDHARDGKDLLLLEALGKRKCYRYLGVFACSSWEYRQGEDLKGNERRAIVYHLIRLKEPAPTADATDVGTPDKLRQRALEAGSQAVRKPP
jgi:5-methylcytosine-specific restriction protein A